MRHEYLGDGKQWTANYYCDSLVQQDIPKDGYKKRCELFEDFQLSFWLDFWLSNWEEINWMIHAHFWLDISRSIQVSPLLNLTSTKYNEGTIKYKVKFAEMVVSCYIKTHPCRYGYLFTYTKWKQLNRHRCCMVTVSRRNDEYFALKVSHDRAPQPIKLQFNF